MQIKHQFNQLQSSQSNTNRSQQYRMSNKNNLILQYASLKPKQRLLSFREFYTRSVKTSPSLPKEKGKYFSTTAANKHIQTGILDREISKKRNKSQKVKTEQESSFAETAKSMEFHLTFETMRKKSLRKMEMMALAQKKIKRKYGERKKADSIFFKYQDVPWVEKRWNTTGVRGKHSQKMHPMCKIYEQCADKIISNRFYTINPFEGYEPIQF